VVSTVDPAPRADSARYDRLTKALEWPSVRAVLLRLTGIGVIGIFTATIPSLFMIEDEEDEFNGLHKRLDGIEAKLDRLVVDGARSAAQEH